MVYLNNFRYKIFSNMAPKINSNKKPGKQNNPDKKD